MKRITVLTMIIFGSFVIKAIAEIVISFQVRSLWYLISGMISLFIVISLHNLMRLILDIRKVLFDQEIIKINTLHTHKNLPESELPSEVINEILDESYKLSIDSSKFVINELLAYPEIDVNSVKVTINKVDQDGNETIVYQDLD